MNKDWNGNVRERERKRKGVIEGEREKETERKSVFLRVKVELRAKGAKSNVPFISEVYFNAHSWRNKRIKRLKQNSKVNLNMRGSFFQSMTD